MRRLRPEIWICQGSEIQSGHPLSMIYAGWDQQYRNYLVALAFGDAAEQKFMGRRWVWRISGFAETMASQSALLVMESDSCTDLVFHSRRTIKMPRWVESFLDTSKPAEMVFPKKAFKEMKRVIGKNSYEYEVARDGNRFHDFYSNMYLPYIQGRFGDTAYVLSKRWYETLIRHSELLLVTTKTAVVAGVLIEYSKNEAHLGYIGYKDGSEKHMKDGALNAILYFSVKHLNERGYRRVSLGPSKSFLKDGRLKFKMLRGASISDKIFAPDENISLQVMKHTPGLRQFFIHNPFVFYPENRIRHAAFFTEAGTDMSYEDIEQMFAPYRSYQGIDMWHLFTFGKRKRERLSFPSPINRTVTISSAQKFFS